VEGFWSTVDQWAADVTEASPVLAWWNSRCRLEASTDRYIDVLGDPPPDQPLLGDAIGAMGAALPDTEPVRALVDGTEHRVVTCARRYRWNGPAMTPVVLEVHTTESEGVLEAWWEDVWAAWPTIRLGRESARQRPPRRATATAQINRLFRELGLEPLKPRD
jgi:hypothetical protein